MPIRELKKYKKYEFFLSIKKLKEKKLAATCHKLIKEYLKKVDHVYDIMSIQTEPIYYDLKKYLGVVKVKIFVCYDLEYEGEDSELDLDFLLTKFEKLKWYIFGEMYSDSDTYAIKEEYNKLFE